MLIVIDTGLASTKAAALVGQTVRGVSFSSSVVRGLIGEQAGGVYCLGKTTNNFQIYSALAQDYGVFPVGAANFREPSNAKRRVLIEHAMTKLSVTGKTNVILTQPAPILFCGGEDQTNRVREAETSLLKMPVGTIDPASGRPASSKWKLHQATASVETVWAIYDLAIKSPATTQDDLVEFTEDRVRVGATVAVVDFGATGTRIHYVEWTGELLPTLVMSRYHEFGLGTEEAVSQIDQRLVERHGYRDVIDIPRLRTDPTILAAGTRVDVSDLVDESIREAVSLMRASGLDQLKGEVEAGEVDHVLFVGGGARIFGGIVAEQFPSGAVLDMENPEQAPVRGLLKARASNGGGGGRSS